MTKVKSKKTTKVRKDAKVDRAARQIIEDGESFGNAIISMMSIFATNVKGMGIAAVGLAKALAALRNIGEVTGIDIKDIYDNELAYFDNKFDEITVEEMLQNS